MSATVDSALLAQLYFAVMHATRGELLPSEAMQQIAEAAEVTLDDVVVAVAEDIGVGHVEPAAGPVVVVVGPGTAHALALKAAARLGERDAGPGSLVVSRDDIAFSGLDTGLPLARKQHEDRLLHDMIAHAKGDLDVCPAAEDYRSDRPGWESPYGPARARRRR